MDQVITPAARLAGSVRLPGDKSISHRYALLAALAEGSSRIENFSTGADCRSTLGCLAALGVPVRSENSTVHIEGRRPGWFEAPGGFPRRGQFRLHHPDALRHPRGAALLERNRRG